MIKEATALLSQNNNLSASQMELAMEEIMSGKAEIQEVVDFLTSLSDKGESVEEVTAAVSVMRRHAAKINVNKKIILDTCGTGGDGKGTFNISTAVAFVAAGCGITVAKHGNRSVSSRSGSADILEALGVNINMPPQDLEACLSQVGIAFLFAPNLHPAMKYVMPARKQIGKRTIFNILGPLSNPAGATHQLVGVFDKHWTKTLARVLGNLGAVHVLVVHGEDGLDEITTTTATTIAEFSQGKLNTYEIKPQDFGIAPAKIEDLTGGTAQDNAGILLGILSGEKGPRRDIVILNAAAAIYAADKVNSIKEALPFAFDSIDSGKAAKKLEELKEYSRKK